MATATMAEIADRKDVGRFFCEAELKASSDENTLEGLASTWELDLDEERIHPGAFKKTIAERVKKGRVPLLHSHFWNALGTIGIVTDAHETQKGLHFKATFATTADAQSIRQKIIDGVLRFLSIGFRTLKADFEQITEAGRVVRIIRHIREVQLFEISVVPIPANEGAAIQRVKALASQPSLDGLLFRAAAGDVDESALVASILHLGGFLADPLANSLKNLLDTSLNVAVEGEASRRSAELTEPGVPPTCALTEPTRSDDPTHRRRLRKMDEIGARIRELKAHECVQCEDPGVAD